MRNQTQDFPGRFGSEISMDKAAPGAFVAMSTRAHGPAGELQLMHVSRLMEALAVLDARLLERGPFPPTWYGTSGYDSYRLRRYREAIAVTGNRNDCRNWSSMCLLAHRVISVRCRI